MSGLNHAAVTVLTSWWTRQDAEGDAFRAATKRALWRRLLRDLPDEWSGHGRIEAAPLDSRSTVVSAFWAPVETVEVIDP